MNIIKTEAEMNNEFHSIGKTSYDELDDKLQNIIKSVLHQTSKGSRFYRRFCYSDITVTKNANNGLVVIDIPHIGWDLELFHLDLYIDGGYVSNLDYIIDENGSIKLNTSIAQELFKDENDTHNAFISIYEYLDHHLNLIKHYDKRVVVDSDTTVIDIPVDLTILSRTLYFDLYINGQYISQNEYTISDQYQLTFNDMTVIPDNDIVFSFIVSFSKHFDVRKIDIDYVTDLRGGFRTDLNETEFKQYRHSIRMFNNGQIISDDKYNVNKGLISIMEREDYIPEGAIKTISLREYLICNIVPEDGDYQSIFEEVYVGSDGIRRAPIPIVDYKENYTDFMTFKESGVYVSPAKFYIRDGKMCYFNHDVGLYSHEKLGFLSSNDEWDIQEFSKFVELLEENQRTVTIPIKNMKHRRIMILLFRAEGVYISKEKYTINEDMTEITFKDCITFEAGDRLEFYFIELSGFKTRFIKSLKTLYINDDNASQFKVPDKLFNVHTDKLVMFRSDGMYIGQGKYTINSEGIVTLIAGSPINKGMWIDFYITRVLPNPIPTDASFEQGGVI